MLPSLQIKNAKKVENLLYFLPIITKIKYNK